ncbi:lysM domain receptor-like kinase 4 [Nicotiana sylvestris]|uniref:lysM domain receptor-like kinase 4 n=1 Tax=Nicotiana sylvestris TaxID=4096 RepID=UPI00388CBB9D
MNFQWLLVICICISSSYGQQFYDSTSCFSNISSPDVLLTLNNVTSSSQILEIGREVIVPIQCSCLGESFQANISYHSPTNTKFDDVACGVFEGLVKSITLLEENISKKTNISDVNYDIKAGTELLMPLKCACPGKFFDVGLKYLITYPFISGDDTGKE